MVAEARIRGDKVVKMLTAPIEAIVRDPQGATMVYVYYPDQKRVYAKRVEIGAPRERDLEIRSGLSGDEWIVLAGQTKLRDGSAVSATEQQSGRKRRPWEERGNEPDKVFTPLPDRNADIDGNGRLGRHSCLPENATNGRPDDYHQNRDRGRDVPGSDLRAGGKTGNKNP